MNKNPQDRKGMPGEKKNEEMENMPKKDMNGMDPKKGEQVGRGQQGQSGQQGWTKGQQGEQGGQPHKGDQTNRPKETDEEMDDRTKRPA